MLDLSSVKVSYFDVKLPDGGILHIKIPTLRFKNEMTNLAKRMEELDEEQQERELNKIVAKILSRNTEGKEFTVEQVAQWLPEPVQQLIVNEYAKFIREVANQKN